MLLRLEDPAEVDHLRVCGADTHLLRGEGQGGGSPPRVRSRPWVWLAIAPMIRDHLRVCGADCQARPPQKPMVWITSACAEQTFSNAARACSVADHLRVCGADVITFSGRSLQGGSPPRVRSRLRSSSDSPPIWGITSACAEQTW